MSSLLEGETDVIANLANASALIFDVVDDLNWAGFYFVKGDELVLGPFQGKPACVRLKLGKGVCGTAVTSEKTIVVPNVHEFEGHIACDGASLSEMVVPLRGKDGQIVCVLDLDSPRTARFGEIVDLIESVAREIERIF